MKCSELTLLEVIKYYINHLCIAKLIFNDIVLYNDYDSETEIENGLYGEILPALSVVPDRIQKFNESIVESINIEIVDFHHCIVTMQGEYKEKR
jgi:hypothetical protein